MQQHTDQTWPFPVLQAISVIVTHRTDDMSKLPPRLPANAPKPRSKPDEASRPKLRLIAPAKPAGAAAGSPVPEAAANNPDPEASGAAANSPVPADATTNSPAPPPGTVPDGVEVPGAGVDVVMDETGDMPERVGEVGGAVDPAAEPASPVPAHAGNAAMHTPCFA